MAFGSRKKRSDGTSSRDIFYLRAVELSDGRSLTFEPGELVLVVGPNNAGKSTFLRNIKGAVTNHSDARKMLFTVEFNTSLDIIQKRLREVYKIQETEHTWYVLEKSGQWDYGVHVNSMGDPKLALYRASDAFVITLNAETRLSLSNPVETLDLRFGRPKHPFHHFLLSRELLRKFAGVTKDAFGLDFTITRIGNPIRGYVGQAFKNDLDNLETDKEIPTLGEEVEVQGDGIRSYTGIAAEFVGSSHPIILLDEPEAFLHPPQAKKLGRLIIDSLPADRQSFVATHSSDFLQGVLSSRSERVRVIRLDRSQGPLTSNSLENAQLRKAVSHPSLANTNLLDALFFSQTVICEADTDCGLFDWAIRELGDDKLRGVDRFWFATGGKHQTPKIAELLATFGVDFRVILDLDALADWDLISRLASLKQLDVSSHKKRLAAALRVLGRPALNTIPKAIVSLLEGKEFQNEDAERQALREVSRQLEKARRSQPLKQHGLTAFNKGQERADAEEFVNLLSEHGIILLRSGEIESYVPEVGLHGPGWASAVLGDFGSHEKKLRQLISDIEPGLV